MKKKKKKLKMKKWLKNERKKSEKWWRNENGENQWRQISVMAAMAKMKISGNNGSV
jgi:hypothetical protein